MKVIGTAGHIDHGKSTLVRRLTGIDPDRLEEEKRRGMTIDLGFAWLTLPSGEEVSVVDVPGHERFVANMLAGAAGIDVALLVIAADESVMPQTREHVDILNLLGVTHGVVALTKSDVADEELVELVAEEARDLLRGTGLAESPIVPVSAMSGTGLDELCRALDVAVATSPPRSDTGLPFLPIDRAFTISGFGTVVTGTLHDGALEAGEAVEIVPSGLRSRIRSLQSHRTAVQRAEAGSRVAVNLPGVGLGALQRGDVIALPGTLAGTDRFDGRLHVVPEAPFPLVHGAAASVHVGTAVRAAKIVLLDAKEISPGGAGWAQIRLEEPVVAVAAQRFIVRLPAPARTVGGGIVVDPAPAHRRRSVGVAERLERLASHDPNVRVAAALAGRGPRTPLQIRHLLRLPQTEVIATLDSLIAANEAVRVGLAYWHRAEWQQFVSRAVAAVSEFHRLQPLKRGMPKELLRSTLHRRPDEWPALLQALVDTETVRDEDALVALPEHRGGSSARQAEADRALDALRAVPREALGSREVDPTRAADPALLAALIEEGEAVKITDGTVLARETFESLLAETMALIDGEGGVTAARLRDALGTSRRFAVDLLEHLDAQRVTRREGDTRVRGSRAPVCA